MLVDKGVFYIVKYSKLETRCEERVSIVRLCILYVDIICYIYSSTINIFNKIYPSKKLFTF